MKLKFKWTPILVATVSAACSGGAGDGANAGQPATPDLSGVSFTGSGNGSGSGSTGDGSGSGDGSGVGFDECAGQAASTEVLPTNLYVMFDVSCSMGCPAEQAGPGLCCREDPNPRIDLVRSAMVQFLQDPNTAGLGAGIGYFGDQAAGSTSCNGADYADQAVPIDKLPGSANAIIDSLNAQVPTGETPTGPAIHGACEVARDFRASGAGGIAILLVTDGVPETPVTQGCDPTLDEAAQEAADCLADGIRTYVIGVGANLENLATLAQAGGTDNAYLVSGTSDVTAEVLSALSQVRESARNGCEFDIPAPPDGQALNPALVNVSYVSGSGDSTLIPGVGSSDNCQDGGWYYDDPTSPGAVVLCPSSCDFTTTQLTANSGRVQVVFGCATVDTIR